MLDSLVYERKVTTWNIAEWLITIMPLNNWNGNIFPFPIKIIGKALDCKEINGRTSTGYSSRSFHLFNIHIKNQWSWGMLGTERVELSNNQLWIFSILNTSLICNQRQFEQFLVSLAGSRFIIFNELSYFYLEMTK